MLPQIKKNRPIIGTQEISFTFCNSAHAASGHRIFIGSTLPLSRLSKVVWNLDHHHHLHHHHHHHHIKYVHNNHKTRYIHTLTDCRKYVWSYDVSLSAECGDIQQIEEEEIRKLKYSDANMMHRSLLRQDNLWRMDDDSDNLTMQVSKSMQLSCYERKWPHEWFNNSRCT